MAYTVSQLAKISGVSVRTLHWYDEIGLLKPAYYGNKGYRYYEEEELFTLQQILFYRELGFELIKIQEILGKGDFDTVKALLSHKRVLQKELDNKKKLIRTIDKTIEHLKGGKKMKENEIYEGFDPKKQKAYEKELIDYFGDQVKGHFAECKENLKGWGKSDWDRSHKEFDEICSQLATLIEGGFLADSDEVKEVIAQHYAWLSQFWKPTKETYPFHGQFIMDSELKKPYLKYHPKMPSFIAEAIRFYSEDVL